MSMVERIREYISTLRIIDTHEHLPMEAQRPADHDVLANWLQHYFNCDLVSAGLSSADLAMVRDPKRDLLERWDRVEPYWNAARNTGYGRALEIAARDLYGVERITRQTLPGLNEKFLAAQTKRGRYREVLQDRSGIALSIRDTQPDEHPTTQDAFVFTMRVDAFVDVPHRSRMNALAEPTGIRVHRLGDWLQVARRYFDHAVAEDTGLVTLKLGLAYQRSLYFEKTALADAERDFNEFFAAEHAPDWRGPRKAGRAFQDFMVHYFCKMADERGYPIQVHTGIQEGNGNVIADANPVLLTNLLLEYTNVKFDLFHMGYPYVMELGNLAKNFPNVFIDMCWGHIISPEAARRALVEWLDAVPANKISAFGGDYCFVDGVYGHQVMARDNVAAALAQKVNDGCFDLDRAREIATWLFVDNPVRIFRLKKFLAA